MRLPDRRQPLPAVTDIHAVKPEAPEQRARIQHVHDHRGVRTAYPRVVKRQHLVPSLLVEIEQRQVPPVVYREEIVLRPVVCAAGEPLLPVRDTIGHLQHVGDGVDRPGVAWIARDCTRAGSLGASVVAHFLEAKGMHAQVVPLEPANRDRCPADAGRHGRAARSTDRGRSRPGAQPASPAHHSGCQPGCAPRERTRRQDGRRSRHPVPADAVARGPTLRLRPPWPPRVRHARRAAATSRCRARTAGPSGHAP